MLEGVDEESQILLNDAYRMQFGSSNEGFKLGRRWKKTMTTGDMIRVVPSLDDVDPARLA